MKKSILISSIGLLACMLACTSSQENNDSTGNTTSFPAVSVPNEPTEPSPTTLEQALAQPAPVPPAADHEVALNPEHGKPGHRCEIPVGAPLNSVPTTTNAHIQSNKATPPPAVNNPIPDLGPVNPALKNSLQGLNNTGKINPPHGQPGHDCAVPVGAPLPAK